MVIMLLYAMYNNSLYNNSLKQIILLWLIDDHGVCYIMQNYPEKPIFGYYK